MVIPAEDVVQQTIQVFLQIFLQFYNQTKLVLQGLWFSMCVCLSLAMQKPTLRINCSYQTVIKPLILIVIVTTLFSYNNSIY